MEKTMLYMTRKKVNTAQQLKIINEAFKGKSAYEISNEIGRQSTVERTVKRFKESRKPRRVIRG